MNGLGIVLEESPQPHLAPPPLLPDQPEADLEALLPPLPDSGPANLRLQMPTAASPLHDSPVSQTPDEKHLSDMFSSQLFTLYELDLPALNIDNISLLFTEPLSTVHLPSAAAPTTLPLKRLQSLKNGIRKLSLSKMTEKEQPPPPRPALTPLPVDDASLQLSTTDSLRLSTFSSLNVHTHTHTNSQGLVVKTRRRTLLNSHSNSAATSPPLPLPIITLLENLSSTRQNLSDVEQTFFESLGVSGEYTGDDSLARLTTLDELIEYLLYLTEHKKLVAYAYAVTKERLSSSGWCLPHDLENLSLQKDQSLSQIYTRLLQIEERLNSDFNLSIFDNTAVKDVQREDEREDERDLALMSPSLKVLESRCLSFGNESSMT